jgi:hypothetical protein
LNGLLAYISRAPASYGTEYHYTFWDVALALLVIVPGVFVWVSILFAGPIQDSIADWWARRKERQHQRALASRRKAERKVEPVGRSRWHGRNRRLAHVPSNLQVRRCIPVIGRCSHQLRLANKAS